MVAHLTKPQATASHVLRHRSEDTQRRIGTGLLGSCLLTPRSEEA